MSKPHAHLPFAALLSSIALPLLLAGPATAQGSAETVFEKAFGTSAAQCFARTYDAQHLSAHPRQKARGIRIAFLPELTPVEGKQRQRSRPERFELAFGVLIKGDSELYAKPAYCRTVGAAFECSLESDGGLFRITLEAGGALRVTTKEVRFEGRKRFIELGGTTSDDGTFIVPRAAAAACSGVIRGTR